MPAVSRAQHNKGCHPEGEMAPTTPETAPNEEESVKTDQQSIRNQKVT